jgi:alpha-mannosidase
VSAQVHIVSHTHWDREWHQTFQQFRLRLIQLIDQVLDLLATDPAFPYFMLDGQTIVLADYIEIRPERRAELRERIAQGRLQIGPWYVHPDEFLVSGESLVRNLLQGLRDCEEWGGRLAIGYVPDQFGHVAQLPQIWRGFDIDCSVLWRGVDRARSGSIFNWRSPDGSAVLAILLPDGYNHAEHLPVGGQALAERLRILAAAQDPPATSGQHFLIMQGGDHSLPDPRPLHALGAAQEALGNAYEVHQSTLWRYREAVKREDPPRITLSGELRDSHAAPLLPGVASSRMWIKQGNAAVQTLLERQAEPLSVLAGALGAVRRGAEIRQSWRYLLQNQPHDSICGCSIDQVHREMRTRFDAAEQIARAIRQEALGTIASRVDSAVPGAEDPHTLAVTVFNGAGASKRGAVTVPIRLAGEATGYELVDAGGQAVPHVWVGERGEPPATFDLAIADAPDQETILAQISGNRVLGMGLQAISMRTIGQTIHVEITVGDQALLSRVDIEQAMRDAFALIAEANCTRVFATIYRSAEVHLTAFTPPVPALGYRTLLLRPRSKPASGSDAQPEPPAFPTIENERYRVEAGCATGALTIVERASGLTVGPANVFLDEGEAGDLYTHAAPTLDSVIGTDAAPRIERHSGPFGQTLQITNTLQVPTALAASRFERAADTVPLPISTTVSLFPGDPLIHFHVTVDNGARDHRLRVHTSVPFIADHAHAADAFGVVRRVAQPDSAGTWVEQPVGTAPHQGVVAIHGAQGCCLLATKGLPEYEVLPRPDGTTQLALTLLRCTGWLSRSDLPARPGDAGPPLPTPEAQCLGTQQFEYALAVGAEPWQDLWAAAQAFAVSLCATTAPCTEGFLPETASLIEVAPAAVTISALKDAEDGRGAILRMYNQDAREHIAHLQLLLPVARAVLVNLAEQDGEVIFEGTTRTEFAIAVRGHGITTVRVEWARG